MKIAFISPEYYDVAHFGVKRKEIPPFGVLYLASVAEEMGINVVLYRVSSEEACIDVFDCDLVCFSIPSSVVYPLIKNVRKNLRIKQGTLLVAGGIHATIYPKNVLEDLDINIVCIGEGEDTLREIILNLATRTFSNISGILYKQGNNYVKTNLRALIANLDELPFPARHLMPLDDIVMSERLSNTNLKIVHLLCSRGCPYRCYFCANQEHSIRYRTGENIRNELEFLVEKYRIEGFCITDDNFIIDKNRIKNICHEIAPLGLKWSSLSRVDTVDLEILRCIKNSGCLELKYGVESGSQRMLNLMNKDITVEQIRNAINITYEIGIKIKAFIIHGFPGENIESTKETINLLEELKYKIERISLFRFAPLPGSYIYKNHEKFNVTLPDNLKDVHIYNNSKKWWGSKEEQKEVCDAYYLIEDYIKSHWDRF